MLQNMVYCLLPSAKQLQLPSNNSQQGIKIDLIITPPWNLAISFVTGDMRHASLTYDLFTHLDTRG